MKCYVLEVITFLFQSSSSRDSSMGFTLYEGAIKKIYYLVLRIKLVGLEKTTTI